MTHRKRGRALSAIEIMVLVSVAGVVLAVFVPTFLNTLRLSKTSEATSELVRMDNAVRAYFLSSHSTNPRPSRYCLPHPAGPTPEQGHPEPAPITFGDATQPGHLTWRALGYEPAGPVRFRYSFIPVATGCNIHGEHLWTTRAEGDLDANGKHSRFERATGERTDGSIGPVGILHVLDRNE